jgi:hypothetical protein
MWQNIRIGVMAARSGDTGYLLRVSEKIAGREIEVPPDMLPEFQSYLGDENTQIQLLGASGLSVLCDPKSKDALINYLRPVDLKYFEGSPTSPEHGHAQTCKLMAIAMAAQTLGRIGDESAIPVLEALKGFPSIEGSNPVVEALAKLGAAKALANTRSDAEDMEIANAASGIGQIRDPNRVPELMKIVQDSGARIAVRTAAVRALCEIESNGAIESVIKTAQDPNAVWNIRATAAISLGKTKNPSVERTLSDLAQDPNATIRAHALTGLALYKPDVYFSRWVDAIMNTREDPRLRASLPTLIQHNYFSFDLIRTQREQLYRCLEATGADGRPADAIRAAAWDLIHNYLNETPPIVLSSPSSPYVKNIKSSLNWRPTDGGRYSYQESQKRAEERAASLIDYASKQASPPPQLPQRPDQAVSPATEAAAKRESAEASRRQLFEALKKKAAVAIGEYDSFVLGTPPSPAKIRFTALPDDAEYASIDRVVGMIVADSNGVVIRTINLGADMGQRTTAWDGRMYDSNGPVVPTGLYTVTIQVRVGSNSALSASDSCKIKVGRPELTLDFKSEGGLDESTLVFNLNGKIIEHSRLILQRTVVKDHGLDFLRLLKVKYRPPATELIIPGENILKADISDMAANRMEQFVYPFHVAPEEDTPKTK